LGINAALFGIHFYSITTRIHKTQGIDIFASLWQYLDPFAFELPTIG
jgi:hypothetical protein